MLDSDRNLAPEPQFSIYLYVLRSAILEVRYRIRRGDPMPTDQLHDLMDAIENIPEFLSEYEGHGGWLVEDNIKWYLERYDDRWGKAPGSFRLLDVLQKAMDFLKSQGQLDKRIALNAPR